MKCRFFSDRLDFVPRNSQIFLYRAAKPFTAFSYQSITSLSLDTSTISIFKGVLFRHKENTQTPINIGHKKSPVT
jgi:hypothetical protein